MSKKVKKIAGFAAPIVGNMIAPGIGGVIGGALGGVASGGGLKGALTGGLTGAAIGYAPQIGGLANSALGLGLKSTSALSGLGGALAGGAAGAVSGGGLKGALMGAAQGGIGGYLTNGGFDSLGVTGPGSILGERAGTPLANGVGPTQGSGILGTVTKAGSDLSSALGMGGGGGSTYGGGSMYNLGGALLGGANSMSATKKAKKDLINAQNQALGVINPYLTSGTAANSRLSELLGIGGDPASEDYGALATPFTPGDLTQDPGYQFRLQEGQNAINRSLGAKGKMFSGEALKAAQDYGQGLADQTYQDAYNRDLETKNSIFSKYFGSSNAGQTAANSASDLIAGIGNAKANAGIAGSNILNQTLASLLLGNRNPLMYMV